MKHILTSAALLLPVSAMAATTTPATAVPALDGPGLALLSLVLATVAVRHLKSRK